MLSARNWREIEFSLCDPPRIGNHIWLLSEKIKAKLAFSLAATLFSSYKRLTLSLDYHYQLITYLLNIIKLRNQNWSFCLWVSILSIIYRPLSFGIIIIIVHNYIFPWTAHRFYCYFIYKVIIFRRTPSRSGFKFDWSDIKIDLIIECSALVFRFFSYFFR